MKNVSAATVRAWGRANLDLVPESGRNCLGETARGRLHPDLIAAFRKANKGKGYEPKAAESREVKFKGVTLDSAGRKVTREVTITTAEARTLLGQPTNTKGRLNMPMVIAAWEAEQANAVADAFANAA